MMPFRRYQLIYILLGAGVDHFDQFSSSQAPLENDSRANYKTI
jgi:hypothetical protein